MVIKWSPVVGLAAAVSLIAGSANAGPVTGINISLPANPDTNTSGTLRVAESDNQGNFSGRTTAPVGEYTVSTECLRTSPCVPMRITSLTVDGRRVGVSANGAYRFAIRDARRAITISGTVAPSETRRR